MSVTVKRSISAKDETRKCAARLWRLIPHILLSLSLVAYAALGALLFQHIEGRNSSTNQREYSAFLDQIVDTVQNFTGKWDLFHLLGFFYECLPCLFVHCFSTYSDNASYTHEHIVKEVETKMRSGFKSIWLQRPDRWTFFGSMFFCCTVFTTVGKHRFGPTKFGE